MRKTALQRMDDLIRWTGIPQGVERSLRRGKVGPPLRRSRWFPLVLLIVATLLAIRYGTNPALFASKNLMDIVMRTIGIYFNLLVMMSGFFGPLAPRREPDEWEAALRHRAMFFSAIVVGGLEVVGVPLLIAFAYIYRWSSGEISIEIGLWFYYLCMVFQLVATLHMSWSIPAAVDGEDEAGLG